MFAQIRLQADCEDETDDAFDKLFKVCMCPELILHFLQRSPAWHLHVSLGFLLADQLQSIFTKPLGIIKIFKSKRKKFQSLIGIFLLAKAKRIRNRKKNRKILAPYGLLRSLIHRPFHPNA